MLLRYGVANHLSVRDYQEISCAASNLKDDDSHLRQIQTKSIRGAFLPVIALYGANAAGKSNLVDALRFMITLIRTSYRRTPDSDQVPSRACKMLGATEKTPSRYDCDVLMGDLHLHYGFESTRKRFVKEFLYSFPNGSKTLLFERDFKNADVPSVRFGPTVKNVDRTLHDLAQNPKALFLSLCRQTEHATFRPIYDFFDENFYSIRSGNTFTEAVYEGLKDDRVRGIVENVIKQVDLGVERVLVEEKPVDDEAKRFAQTLGKALADFTKQPLDELPQFPDARKIFFHHRCGDKRFKLPIDDESSGTSHLLRLLVPTILSLRKRSHGDTRRNNDNLTYKAV